MIKMYAQDHLASEENGVGFERSSTPSTGGGGSKHGGICSTISVRRWVLRQAFESWKSLGGGVGGDSCYIIIIFKPKEWKKMYLSFKKKWNTEQHRIPKTGGVGNQDYLFRAGGGYPAFDKNGIQFL